MLAFMEATTPATARDAEMPRRAVTSQPMVAMADSPRTPTPGQGHQGALRAPPPRAVQLGLSTVTRPLAASRASTTRRRLWAVDPAAAALGDVPDLAPLSSVWATPGPPLQGRHIDVLDVSPRLPWSEAPDAREEPPTPAAAVSAAARLTPPTPALSAKDRWLQQRDRRRGPLAGAPPSKAARYAANLEDLLREEDEDDEGDEDGEGDLIPAHPPGASTPASGRGADAVVAPAAQRPRRTAVLDQDHHTVPEVT